MTTKRKPRRWKPKKKVYGLPQRIRLGREDSKVIRRLLARCFPIAQRRKYHTIELGLSDVEFGGSDFKSVRLALADPRRRRG